METKEKVNPKNLKIGDILIYSPPQNDTLSNFTIGNKYSIVGFYENRYGIVILDDKRDTHQICNDLVEKFFTLPTTNDNINHPSYYTSHPSGIECIEITRHYCKT